MDDSELNIDVVFRNGLKDYEVLPPQESWDKIRAAVKKKQRPILMFRAAAIIAVVLSLSLLTYRWSSEFSSETDEQVISQDLEPATAEPVLLNTVPAGITSDRSNIVLLSDASQSSVNTGSEAAPADNPVITILNFPLVPEPEMTARDLVSDQSYQPVFEDPGISIVDPWKNEPGILTESVEQNRKRRWSISALVSPTYYNRLSSGNNEAMASLIASEQPVISYTGGVALSYKVGKRISIQSGVYYSSIGNELSGISTFSGFKDAYSAKGGDRNFSIVTTNGNVFTNNGDVFLLDNNPVNKVANFYNGEIDPVKANLKYIDNSLRQSFSYLELPVFIRYKIIDKTLDINVIGGLSSNMLVNNTVSASNDGGRYQVGETEGLNNFTFSSSLGMGMEYNFSENISMNLEPTVRYYLNPFVGIPGMKIHPYSFGIFSGFTYKF